MCLAMSVDSMFAWLGEHHSWWSTWNWEPVGSGFRCAADWLARLLSEGEKIKKLTQKLCEHPKQQHEK